MCGKFKYGRKYVEVKAYEVTNLIFKRLNAVKRVSRIGISEDELKEYLYTIDYINSLSRDDEFVTSRDRVDSYVIPDFMKDMIYPSSITITGDRLGKDFCSRPSSLDLDEVLKDQEKSETMFCEVLSSFDFNNFTSIILNALRNESKSINIKSLRNDVIITEVYKRSSYNGNAVLNGVFYPIPLTVNPYYKESVLNMNEHDLAELWISEVLR